MKRIFLRCMLFLLTLTVCISSFAEEIPDINTILMRSTFKLEGQALGEAPGKSNVGTVFILGKPSSADPKKSFFVLVTAGHVLKRMAGDEAVLYLRKKTGDTFQRMPYPIKIRENGRPVWTSHPQADVAVMYVWLPNDADITTVSTDLLATDKMLKEFDIHPGDRLSCLGYPMALEANDAGFPILRSGQVASYPLTPTKDIKTFLFDFNVFGGNSGGPVYLRDSNRTYGGGTQLGTTVQFLVGLVSEQHIFNEEIKAGTEKLTLMHQLGLAKVIHASLIKEALDLLPPVAEK